MLLSDAGLGRSQEVFVVVLVTEHLKRHEDILWLHDEFLLVVFGNPLVNFAVDEDLLEVGRVILAIGVASDLLDLVVAKLIKFKFCCEFLQYELDGFVVSIV